MTQIKQVYNRSTGQHEPANPTQSTSAWYRKAFGMAVKEEGVLAKSRAEVIEGHRKAAE